jgi:hypothetical protein
MKPRQHLENLRQAWIITPPDPTTRWTIQTLGGRMNIKGDQFGAVSVNRITFSNLGVRHLSPISFFLLLGLHFWLLAATLSAQTLDPAGGGSLLR